MRTTPETSRILYNWITLQQAAKQLGGMSADHVLALGELGELEIIDLRLPDAKRGMYRVNPDGIPKLIEKRRIGPKKAA